MSEAVSQDVQQSVSPGVLGGAMIVSGTCIGAGMFSLPIVSSGMWFGWSIAALFFVWYSLYSSGLYFTETSLNYPVGTNYSKMAKDTLGRSGQLTALLSVGFICYILTYAYISGGSSVLGHTLESVFAIELAPWAASLGFVAVLSLVVLLGSRAVDRVSTAMVAGMVFTFVSSVGDLMDKANPDTLFPGLAPVDTVPYLWGALPFLVVSFGYHTAIPSLMLHYNGDRDKVIKSVKYGSLLSLGIYLCWQIAVLGNVDRQQMAGVVEQGGNMGVLLGTLEQAVSSTSLEAMLQIFSKMAVATSFIGVALGLFDFLNNLCGFGQSAMGRAKTAALTFVPPTLLGVLMPDGFIVAIGYAALVATVLLVILPGAMTLVWRRRAKQQHDYRVRGGMSRVYFVLGSGVLFLLCELATLTGWLPSFAG